MLDHTHTTPEVTRARNASSKENAGTSAPVPPQFGESPAQGVMIACKACGTRGDHYCPADVAREFEYRCERCEEMCDELLTVEDKDASVGYSDTLEVCRNCFETRVVGEPGSTSAPAIFSELTEDEIAYVRMDRTITKEERHADKLAREADREYYERAENGEL